MVSTAAPQTNLYNPLCYPKHIETNLKKELTKQIVIFTIAIVFIVAATCALILVTNILAPEILHIAVTVAGLSTPFAFSFFALSSYNKIQAIQKRLKEERKMFASGVPTHPSNEIEAKHILHKRQRLIPDKINPEDIKKHDVSAVANNTEAQIKKKYLEFLYDNPTNKGAFEDVFTFHFKDYNSAEVTKMVRDRLPFCTKTVQGVETKVYWGQCF